MRGSRTLAAAAMALSAASAPAAASASTAPVAPAAAAAATPTGPEVFTRLAGTWTGTGQLLGRPATFQMHWEPAGDRVLCLEFSNAWVNDGAPPTPVLTSHALYRAQGDSALGVWIDSRPQQLRLEAALTDTSIVTRWTADAEQGRTEYVVRSPDEVTVRDYVKSPDGERQFAEAVYHRSSAPGGPMRVDYSIVFVSDMKQAVAFYRDILGLPLRFESPGWTEFATEGATLALHASSATDTDPDDLPPGRCRHGFSVPDLAAFHRRMVEKGVKCLQEPKEIFGTPVAQYVDPDGAPFSVGEDRKP